MKLKIMTMTILGSLLAVSTFAAGIDSINNSKIIKQKRDIKKEIISQNLPTKKEKIGSLVEKKELTLVELLSKAKTEKERRIILMEKRAEKTLFSEKTEKIFTNFDFILEKLEKVKLDVDKEVGMLKDKEVDIKFLNEHDLTFNSHLNQARSQEVLAWLKIQDIDFNGEKKEILDVLEEVKLLLADSKTEIKLAFADLKEMLSFIKGAVVILE